MHVRNGVIVWGSYENAASKDVNGTTESNSNTESSSKKKKSKKSSDLSNEEDTSLVASQLDKKLQAINGIRIRPAKRITVLRAMLESILHRNAAYSAVLLSDATRMLRLPVAVLLLRLFALTLRGLCDSDGSSAEILGTNSKNDDSSKVVTDSANGKKSRKNNNSTSNGEISGHQRNTLATSMHITPNFGDIQIRNAVTWIEVGFLNTS